MLITIIYKRREKCQIEIKIAGKLWRGTMEDLQKLLPLS